MLDEIETGTTIFIDANIFLYEILDHWKYAESCNSFLEHINMGKYHAVMSVLECSKKYGVLSNDAVHLAYLLNTVWSTSWHRKAWVKARNLTAEHAEGAERRCSVFSAVRKVISRLHKNDHALLSVFHLATMKRHGITNIATNDRDFERAPWLNIWKS